MITINELIRQKERIVKRYIRENEKQSKWSQEISQQIRNFLGQREFDKYVRQITKEGRLMKLKSELKILKYINDKTKK